VSAGAADDAAPGGNAPGEAVPAGTARGVAGPEPVVAVTAQVEGGATVAAVAAAAPDTGDGDAPAAVAVAVAQPGEAPQVADLDLHAFSELWPAVIDSLREESGMLAAALQAAHPARLGSGELTLAWPETAGLHRRKAEDVANREAIARAIRAVTGTSLRLAHEIRSDAAEIPAAAPILSEDEVIERFQKEFDAEILSDDEAESREP
jgi:DNA polymerase-3 subunit gamma/tau